MSSEEISLEDIKELNSVLREKFNVTIVGDLLNLVEKVQSKCPDLENKMEVSGNLIRIFLFHISKIFLKL